MKMTIGRRVAPDAFTARPETVRIIFVIVVAARAQMSASPSVRVGAAAFGDWQTDAPGVRRVTHLR